MATDSMVKLRQIDEYRWLIPQRLKMRVEGLIYAESNAPAIQSDQSLEQVANVATLPGIVGASLAMPDIHWGYGFSIGGVAAIDLATRAWFRPAGWATTSTAACACCGPTSPRRGRRRRSKELWSTHSFRDVPSRGGVGGPVQVRRRRHSRGCSPKGRAGP